MPSPTDIYSAFKVVSDTIRVTGRLVEFIPELRKQKRIRQSELHYGASEFLEVSFKNRNISGQTGAPEDPYRSGKYANNATPLPDKRRIAENIAWDLQASKRLIGAVSKQKGYEYEIMRDDDLREGIMNSSGFIIGGPVPNPVSDRCLRDLNENGLDVGFDLSDPHFPLNIDGKNTNQNIMKT